MRITIVSLLSSLCIIGLTLSCQKSLVRPNAHKDVPRMSFLIDEHVNVREPILDLMELTEVKAPSPALIDVIASTQTAWRRPQNVEFEHLREEHGTNRHAMLKAFHELGLIGRVMPTSNHYDVVLLLGAMYSTVKERLAFLEDLHDNGVRFKKLALLGSERPLDPNHELKAILREKLISPMPATEIEMMEALFKRSSLSAAIASENIIRIAPVMKIVDGQLRRPITKDTIDDFLAISKEPQKTLVISNQPHLLRQDLVVRNTLPLQWPVETVGPAANVSRLVTGVFLDELTKTLYEIKEHLQRKRSAL